MAKTRHSGQPERNAHRIDNRRRGHTAGRMHSRDAGILPARPAGVLARGPMSPKVSFGYFQGLRGRDARVTRMHSPWRSRLSPGCNRKPLDAFARSGALTFWGKSQQHRYWEKSGRASPASRGRSGRFSNFFPFHATLTPLAEVAPSCEHGIRRQRVSLCVSFDAVIGRRCDIGPWRLRAMVGEKTHKNARNPRVRPSTGFTLG